MAGRIFVFLFGGGLYKVYKKIIKILALKNEFTKEKCTNKY